MCDLGPWEGVPEQSRPAFARREEIGVSLTAPNEGSLTLLV
jgi:hypothetical protein